MDSMREWEGSGGRGLMRVECLDILGRRNGCCRGTKGTMRQVEAEGLVLRGALAHRRVVLYVQE